ncbi:MAG: hypothetical protein LBV12_06490 [Puniceicoccales bacterium]|jgi:hypothetical protein|nr:hypothetical protein [Puniceicoccales bacterium]
MNSTIQNNPFLHIGNHLIKVGNIAGVFLNPNLPEESQCVVYLESGYAPLHLPVEAFEQIQKRLHIVD